MFPEVPVVRKYAQDPPSSQAELKLAFKDRIDFTIPKNKTEVTYCTKHHSVLCKSCPLERKAQRDKSITNQLFSNESNPTCHTDDNRIPDVKPSDLENDPCCPDTSQKIKPVLVDKSSKNEKEPDINPIVTSTTNTKVAQTQTKSVSTNTLYPCKHCGCCCCIRDKFYKRRLLKQRRPWQASIRPSPWGPIYSIYQSRTTHTRDIDLPLIVPRHYQTI